MLSPKSKLNVQDSSLLYDESEKLYLYCMTIEELVGDRPFCTTIHMLVLYCTTIGEDVLTVRRCEKLFAHLTTTKQVN